jgi:hypothetical protein
MSGLVGEIRLLSGEYRSCTVNGRNALFHRWTDKESIFLECEYNVRSDKLSGIMDMFNKSNILPSGTHANKIRNTVGIVEFEDGIVKEVPPTDIRFLDSHNFYFGTKED